MGAPGILAAIDLDPGERVAALMLLALLGSFLFIRTSARLMRSPKVPWWPGSVTSGDLHIHHLVWGIVLVLVSGFLGFALTPESPWIEILAVLFGIGAGLTLDEFALWLHLEDVYWSEEGRRSIDAVVIAVVFASLVMVGLPLEDPDEEGGVLAFAGLILVRLVFVSLAVLKGKYVLGLVGFFAPLVSEIAAIRLARPDSPWARRRYPEGSKKMARAREREERWSRRRNRWRDLIGGAPSRPST
jgi:hypothetical protein